MNDATEKVPVLAIVGEADDHATAGAAIINGPGALMVEASKVGLKFLTAVVGMQTAENLEASRIRTALGGTKSAADKAAAFRRFCTAVEAGVGTTTLGPEEMAQLYLGLQGLHGYIENALGTLNHEMAQRYGG